MRKERDLQRIAIEIGQCRTCKKGCTGRPVPGEGSAAARVVFIGEAPGKEEARTGRPFVGRSGKLLRQAIRDIGLDERDVFITSSVHYLPLSGKPTREMVVHGREHLFRQLEVIRPEVVVLLGKTACLALLGRTVEVAKDHGMVVRSGGRSCFITLHPAYAMRFPTARKQFLGDFRKLRRVLRSRQEGRLW
jgi:DNA polymerase